MPSSPSKPVWYVYGIVSADMPLTGLPRGLDDTEVSLERLNPVAALVSILDGSQYESTAMDTNSGDIDWLSPRAVTHDLVLTWASERGVGAVVPLPMFSLFSGRHAVQAMLRDRASQLSATLERVGQGREYALRVYRVDVELLDALPSLSPRLKELADGATAASPGQRYLLERKLDAEKKTELRTVTQHVVDEIMMELGRHTVDHRRSPIGRAPDADGATRGTIVLNAAFLIAPAVVMAFQEALASLVERRGKQGFRFDFSGPWPPYHFVNEADSAQ